MVLLDEKSTPKRARCYQDEIHEDPVEECGPTPPKRLRRTSPEREQSTTPHHDIPEPLKFRDLGKNPGGGPKKNFEIENPLLRNTFVVFDWDDTLFPSTYLNALRIDWLNEPKQSLLDEMARLEEEVLDMFLETVETVGHERVAIITNAEEGWIELSGRFMPRLLREVQQCRILSARSTFEQHCPGVGPFEWKVFAFQFMTEATFGTRFPRPHVYRMKLQYQLVNSPEYETHDDFSADRDEHTKHQNELEKENYPEGSDQKSGKGFDAIKGTVPDEFDDEEFQSESEADCDKPTNGYHLSSSACGNNLDNGEDDEVDGDPELHYEPMYVPSGDVVVFPELPKHVLSHNSLVVPKLSQKSVDSIMEERKVLFSVGDSLAEKIACQQVAGSMPNTMLKTIKFIDRPNMEQLIVEVQLVKAQIRRYLEKDRPLDITVSVPLYEHETEMFESRYYADADAVSPLV